MAVRWRTWWPPARRPSRGSTAGKEAPMARYRILAWRDIPTQVQATDAAGTVAKRVMPRWFMQEISRITMREGIAGTDGYLAEFDWSRETERDGTADEVADAMVAELCARWGRTADGRRIARTEPSRP
jgi:hypothetical protein